MRKYKAPKITETLLVEIGDREFEISCADFSPPTRGTWDDPPDGGDCCVAPFVKVTYNGDDEQVVTYDSFIIDYAIDRKLTVKVADENITSYLHQIVLEEFMERLNDGPDYDRDDGDAWEGGFCDNH